MKTSWKQLLLDHQVKIRFLIVGIWNTVFGYGAFLFLYWFFNLFLSPRYMAYMTASIVGNIIAITNAFIFHKYFTFKSSEQGWDALREYFRFAGTYLFSFILGLILLPLFVEVFGMTPQIAAAVIILICTVFSYIGHSRFSFRS
ncbi:MAG TPA: GtrA family protein, partial [Paludibacter sp.]|nr:GtrA family protein [Paludibacter sp.]